MMASSFAEDVDTVVRSDNCSGCGACALISRRVSMSIDAEGFCRPVLTDTEEPVDERREKAEFAKTCPGRTVTGTSPEGSVRHEIFGPVTTAWEAWAADGDFRFRGSSGGVLSALSAWLVETGQSHTVIGASADRENPARSVPIQITSKKAALEAAGSRYAPVSNAEACDLDNSHIAAFVGKPCEVSAINKLSELRGIANPPILLSFFCAGVPSQRATEKLAATLGVSTSDEIESLRYRGHGWPGDFSISATDGRTVQMSYDESWGKYLGPTMQFRCKICPDGVGESADIVAGDYWNADKYGYPVFANQDGVSVVIARTSRGSDLMERAIASGIIIARGIDLDSVAAVQPLQVDRRTTVCGRLLGMIIARRRIPIYRGFGLFRFAVKSPIRNLRYMVGTWRRSKR